MNGVHTLVLVQGSRSASSVTDQCVISPSLLAKFDHDAIIHPDLRIGLGRTSWGAS